MSFCSSDRAQTNSLLPGKNSVLQMIAKLRCPGTFRCLAAIAMVGVVAGVVSESLPIAHAARKPLPVAAQRARIRNNSQSAEKLASEHAEQSQRTPSKDKSKTVRLNFYNTRWTSVLEKFAKQTGSTLVMRARPGGRYTRRDRTRYTRAEAIRILNQELERSGYTVLDEGQYLIVINMHELRRKYRRPNVPKLSGSTDKKRGPIERASHQNTQNDPLSVTRALATRESQNASQKAQPDTPIRHTALDLPGERKKTAPVSGNAHSTTLKTHRLAPSKVASVLYRAFRPRSELIHEGIDGRPAFRVYTAPKDASGAEAESHRFSATQTAEPELLFTMGVDNPAHHLVITASPQRSRALAKLVREIDLTVPQAGNTIRLVAMINNTDEIARKLRPNLQQLIARRPSAERRIAQRDSAGAERERQDVPADSDELDGVDGLQGNVDIQSIDELGTFLIRGNKQDLEAVRKIIREIEKLGLEEAPEIHVHKLKHVNSEAMAALLNDVYERLNKARGRNDETGRAVSFIPVVKPNSLLILAPKTEMEAIIQLADKLDQPVDPTTEVEVIRLRSAVATDVAAMLNEYYSEPQGLGARVKATADPRTNSLIIRARPSDLDEVAKLVKEIDHDESKAVSRMRIFPLKNALAAELAEVINQAIQSMLNPATSRRGGSQPQSSGGPTANQTGPSGSTRSGSQQRQSGTKSVALEFLSSDGDVDRVLRSGIVADIRITADLRSNALVVTAPEQSMSLIAALIKHLDAPTSTVAEIKVYSLDYADASAMVQLLERMFGSQPGGPQTGAPISVADDSGGNVVPLRFSVDVRTNSIIVVGSAEAQTVVAAILLRLDGGDNRQRQSTVIQVKNSPVEAIATAINDFLNSRRDLSNVDPELVSSVEQLEREVVVVAEPESNSLLISATPDRFDEIKELVARLDEAPKQVIIQALLVEVELENTDEFGIELGFQDRTLFDRGITTEDELLTIDETNTSANGVQTTTQRILSQASTPGFFFNNSNPLGNNVAGNPSDIATQALSNFSLGRANTQLGFGGLVLAASSHSVNVLIRALAAQRNVHILSRPQIRAIDNQEAFIQVGQEVPVVDSVDVGPLGNANPIIVRDRAGIILTVRPRISPDGTIVMQVSAEKSQFPGDSVPVFTDVSTGNVVAAPIKNLTTALTTVAVPDGQTIVLGGMITKVDSNLERKVPWFGDLPLLGKAFRYDSTSSARTELLIFLTPRIIKNPADSEMIKQIESERLHFIVDEAEAIHGPILSVPNESLDGCLDCDSFDQLGGGNGPAEYPRGYAAPTDPETDEPADISPILPEPDPLNSQTR